MRASQDDRGSHGGLPEDDLDAFTNVPKVSLSRS